MTSVFFVTLFLGFLHGVRHALEPDHMIAVSTIAAHSKSLRRSSLVGVYWGIGHTATLFVIGVILLLIKGQIPASWEVSLEIVVGVMLVYLGASSIYSHWKKPVHAVTHTHSMNEHNHFVDGKNAAHPEASTEISFLRSVFIGFVHGLAGSAAMVAATMATVSEVWQGSLYILIFGVGTIVGMLLFTTLLGVPFALSQHKLSLHHRLTQAAGWISVCFGFYYICEKAFL